MNLDTGEVTVHQQRTTVNNVIYVRPTKTDAGERVAFLDPGTIAVLRRWRRRQLEERMRIGQAYHDEGWLFAHEDGQPLHPDSVSKRFYVLVRRSGLPPVRFHDLRHTAVSNMLNAGVTAEIVANLVGHSSSKITEEVYGHLWSEAGRAAAAAGAGLVPAHSGCCGALATVAPSVDAAARGVGPPGTHGCDGCSD